MMNKEIKASELRIGNYLIDSNSRLCVVDTLSKDIIDCGIFAVHDCITTFPIQPIPLTERWLLKFGFEELDHRRYEKKYRKSYYIGGFLVNDCFMISLGSALAKPQHVHQLQNLYFALTGEELNLINEL